MPVTNQESERSYFCVLWVSIYTLSTTLIFDFRIVVFLLVFLGRGLILKIKYRVTWMRELKSVNATNPNP